MIKLIKNRWLRWGSFILLGILFRFLLDVIFSLQYRNYELFQSFAHYLVAVLITLVIFESNYHLNNFIKRKVGWHRRPYKQFFIQWISNLAIAIFFALTIRWIIVLILYQFTYVNIFDEIIVLVFVILVISITNMVDLGVFLLEKWRFSLAELERFKKQNAEFRFEFLRAQVNPHFLFNSLNTLSSLVFENQEKAAIFTRELADVYRYILDSRDKELTSLRNEIKMLQSYIFLMQLRFEKSLNINLAIAEETLDCEIAPLTLQMLVENAAKHNVISKKRPLHIQIFTEDESIVVSNNLQVKKVLNQTGKMGLKNIKNRYSYLTKREIEIRENQGFFVVKIPLIQSV